VTDGETDRQAIAKVASNTCQKSINSSLSIDFLNLVKNEMSILHHVLDDIELFVTL